VGSTPAAHDVGGSLLLSAQHHRAEVHRSPEMLFVGYRTLNPEPDERRNPGRIELTNDDLHQLEVGWTAQWRRPPTPEEMRRLKDAVGDGTPPAKGTP
jgi:hypothetical protein